MSDTGDALSGQTAHAPEPFQFTGTGAEYFGIWIVNLLLTILTVGIYSAWAKVRRMQYFCRHTEVAGSGFDFHGNPLRILVGRIIAVILLFAYQVSVRLHSPLTLVVIALLAVVLPWLLRSALRFRLHNLSWRGTRFRFAGSLGGAYRVFLLNFFLAGITLYLLAPFTHQRLKAYQHGNSWFGQTPFTFHARAGQFYLRYLLIVAAIAGAVALVIVSGIGAEFIALSRAGKSGAPQDPRVAFRVIGMLYAVIILLSVSIGPVFRALMTNLIWNNTRLGEHRIECALSPWMLIWLTLSNMVAVIVSLGLLTPWAHVRWMKYEMSCIRLLPASDLGEFQAAAPEDVGAVGEEVASVFDFDIAL